MFSINLYTTAPVWVSVIVFNATFHNISAISWRSVSLVEETGVPGENHRPLTLSDNVVSSTPRIRTQNRSGHRH